MTPTEFLYKAAQTSKVVTTPTGKKVRLPELALGDKEGLCWLCGSPTTAGFLKKKIIKPTFTDGDLAKQPMSDVVCEYCTWALSERTLRNYSLLANVDGLQFPSRQEWRSILLNPPQKPSLCTLAVSGQKWLHFKARINIKGGYPLVVLLEETEVIVSESFKDLLYRIEELYSHFTKAEIESGHFKSHKIQEFGIERWQQLEDEICNKRGSRIFDLAIFVAQKPGDL